MKHILAIISVLTMTSTVFAGQIHISDDTDSKAIVQIVSNQVADKEEQLTLLMHEQPQLKDPNCVQKFVRGRVFQNYEAIYGKVKSISVTFGTFGKFDNYESHLSFYFSFASRTDNNDNIGQWLTCVLK